MAYSDVGFGVKPAKEKKDSLDYDLLADMGEKEEFSNKLDTMKDLFREIQGTTQKLEEESQESLRQAKEEAKNILESARLESRQMLSEAEAVKRQAEQIRQNALRESKQMMLKSQMELESKQNRAQKQLDDVLSQKQKALLEVDQLSSRLYSIIRDFRENQEDYYPRNWQEDAYSTNGVGHMTEAQESQTNENHMGQLSNVTSMPEKSVKR